MKIYITGVTGFVGGRLAQEFLQQGHGVSGSGSSEAARSRAPEGLERFDVLRLGEQAPPGAFDDFDALIHGAYNPEAGTEELNVEGTWLWRQAAAEAGVQSQIFISSHSAEAGASSEYGRQKYRLESLFLEHGHHVARCGLVVGNGGLFRRMMGMVQRLPVLPLLDGGQSPTLVTDPVDLARAMEHMLVHADAPKDANLFHPDPISLGDLLRATRRALGCRTLFLPIPSALLLPPLWLARRLRIPLPVNEENLRGYRSNRAVERRSDIGAVLDAVTPLQTTIENAAADFRAHKESVS